MADLVEIKVPDIGDFSDVPIIEVFVSAGDEVAPEDPLITLESDKATMDVPSPAAGTVKDIAVSVGDTVSEASLILHLDSAAVDGKAGAPAAPAEPAQPAPAPAAGPPPATFEGDVDVECDVVVLGAGPGGYTAAFRAADLGLKTVLVERYDRLGGVCLNVGCIPSKALLHMAGVIAEAEHSEEIGLKMATPEVDLEKLREFKDGAVQKLTGGLVQLAKQRKIEVVRGTGRFTGPHSLDVDGREI